MRPALYSAAPPRIPPLGFVPFQNGFCIPQAFADIPFGDGHRIWQPAFGCYARMGWQERLIEAARQRGYTWWIDQLSGNPYREDYPVLPLNVNDIVEDLSLLRQSGLRTIVAFRDDRGADLSYLRPVAAVTQDLVDCVMGIFEVNGVFAEPDGTYSARTYAAVESVLLQQHLLYPHAINAFHSASNGNGDRGFGEKDFWLRVAPFVDVYFLQMSVWPRQTGETQDSVELSAIDRMYDWTDRLMGGEHDWPVLRKGVVLAELTTTRTFRDWTEQEGQRVTDRLMTAPLRDRFSRHPAGYLDGGTVPLV